MIGRILKLAVVAVLLTAAYVVFRPEADAALDAIRQRWDVLRRDTVVAQVPAGPVSEQTAEAAERKMDRLRDGSNRESFAGNELQSLLEYRYSQMLPAFVTSPRIAIEQDEVAVRVRLPAERLPRPDDFGQILMLLPDTTDLAIRGTIIPSDDGFVAFTVDAISAQRIPLPSRLVPSILDMFGRQNAPGLPDDAIRIPLPDGARTAYVRADSLVVLSPGTR
jgi:hypothetical protein